MQHAVITWKQRFWVRSARGESYDEHAGRSGVLAAVDHPDELVAHHVAGGVGAGGFIAAGKCRLYRPLSRRQGDPGGCAGSGVEDGGALRSGVVELSPTGGCGVAVGAVGTGAGVFVFPRGKVGGVCPNEAIAWVAHCIPIDANEGYRYVRG
jgi:hypothetical protein